MKIFPANIKNLRSTILFVLLLVSGLYFRVYGLNENYSFWTDENDVAVFSRAIVESGRSVLVNGYSTGAYQWLQHWLSAISAKIFGLNEFAVRLPTVFFGIFTILAVYLLAKELFNKKVGFLSAVFITFLNMEILYSRQARPYQSLQFFYLLGMWFVYSIAKEEKLNWRYFSGFLVCGILASLMHGLGLIIFFNGFLYLWVFRFSWFKRWIVPAILMTLLFGYIFRFQISTLFLKTGSINNLFYYRVFLIHNYLSLCLLAVLGGFLLIWRKNYRGLLVFVLSLGVQFIIVSFFLVQPFTRYFYPVFPFIILSASYGILEIGNWELNIRGRIFNPQHLISGFLILVVVFFLGKSDKFSFFPKKVYSLNSDMQEVPEVDWKKIYSFVSQKIKENHGAVLATNWSDLPVWYLGEGRLDYLVRKEKTGRDAFSGANIINSLEEFVKLLKTQEKGIFVLDSWDNVVPDGIREFCHDNLKRELEIDRLYPVQPRYWTVWVYSWGI